MAISDRIEAIEQHLTDDYSVLTLAGADLTNVDKNILNLKTTWQERLLYFMNNGTDVVWNNWNKVTGEGTSIILNNTLEAKMKIILKGNTLQNGEPTPDSPIPIQVVSGDNSIEVENNVFDISTITPNSFIDINSNIFPSSASNLSDYIEVKENDIILSYDYTSLVSTNTRAYCWFDSNKNFISGHFYYPTNKTNTFSVVSGAKYIRITYDKNISNIKVSNESTSYPISLGVENSFNPQDFITAMSTHYQETKTINGIEFICLGREGSTTVTYTYELNCKEDTQYTLSMKYTNSNCSMQFKYSDGTSSSTFPTASSTITDYSITSASNKTITGIIVNCYGWYSTGSKLEIGEIGLTEGATAQHVSTNPIQLLHIPNTNYYDKIDKSSGKNLIDINTNVLNDCYIATADMKLATASGATCYWFEAKDNTTYTMSRDKGDRLIIGGYNSIPQVNDTGTLIYDGGTSTATTYTFTNTNYKYIVLYLSRNATATPNWVMLNEGSTSLPYEPYGTSWYVKKEVGKLNLSPIPFSAFNSSANNTARIVWYSLGHNYIDSTSDLCNRLPFNINIWNLDVQGFSVGNSSGYIITRINKSIVGSTEEEANTWLSNNDLIIYAPLATPTYTLIEDSTLINQLESMKKSYEGQTNISQTNNDLPSTLNATALEEM